MGGNVTWIQNHEDCSRGSARFCRMFVESDDGLLYYIAHFSFDDAPDGSMLDDFAEDVASWTYNMGDNGGGSRRVEQGQQVGRIVRYQSPDDWNHVHLSIFDPTSGYDNLDPLPYLIRTASGDEGETLTIVDDERPQVDNIQFFQDGTLTPATSSFGICGDQIQGPVDILADMADTFSTSRPVPNDFPGRDGWNNQIGVAGARYVTQRLGGVEHEEVLWYESEIGCVGTECTTWRLPFPNAGRPASNDHLAFVDTFLSGEAPEFAGGDFAPALYEAGISSNNHAPDPAAPFIHRYYLTNGAREADTSLPNGSWDPTVDGIYAVTVEAWDQAGNLAQETKRVVVNNSGQPASFYEAPVYARDHTGDLGQVPSNLGNEPFWNSPDIFVLPELAGGGTPAPPSPTANPVGTPLLVGETYYVYVRVTNPGCTTQPLPRVFVWSARPATVFVDENYLGTSAIPTTIAPGGVDFVGPIPWTVTQQDLDNASQGHRCLLARLADQGETNPGGIGTLDAPNDPLVVQRNVQASELKFWIRNESSDWEPSMLSLEFVSFPTGGTFQLSVERTPELDAAWQGVCEPGAQPDPSLTCTVTPDWYVLDVHKMTGVTPTWQMPPVSELEATATFSLPTGTYATVVARHSLDGTEVGGMTFQLRGPAYVR